MVPKIFKLQVKWNKKENDFVIHYPRKADGGFIHTYLLSKRLITSLTSNQMDKQNKNYQFHDHASWNKNISLYNFNWIKDLEERGYDLTTLKFEITISKDQLQEHFSHLWDELTEKQKKDVIRLGFKKPLMNKKEKT